MPAERNFLLGYGERLTDPVVVRRAMSPVPAPYTFDEAKLRVSQMVRSTVSDLGELPPKACPDDYAVGLVTLHPQYTAKSYFPGKLLQAAHVEAIGSRPA